MRHISAAAARFEIAADELFAARQIDERCNLAVQECGWMQLPAEIADRRAVVCEP